MPVELDHLFICVSNGAPEAERLVQAGLVEGAPNTHSGQGTACRRFFFHNAYLELVWVADLAEARSSPGQRTCLSERWLDRGRGASPFGIALRPGQGALEIPFPTWEYRPAYLPPSLAFDIGTNCERVTEPLLFFLSFGRRADSAAPAQRQPIDHPAGFREITSARISSPDTEPASTERSALERHCPWLTWASGSEHLLEIGFDGSGAGQATDLRPVLPLILRW